tara:strand:+ start:39739 stop:40215 length:477 start_codon:yes stop_codon:yes gene_type:complete
VTGLAGHVELREPVDSDLDIIFPMTQDPVANQMSMVYPRSREAFEEQWNSRSGDPASVLRIILLDGEIVGRINSFTKEGETHVGYLIAQEHWGKGVMTAALTQFVGLVERRPLEARAAKSNLGSCRVLEKCGFEKIGEWDSPETERYIACVECVYRLD